MYGRKASELVKEFASSEPGQISTFNVSNIVLQFMWSLIFIFTGLVYLMVWTRPSDFGNDYIDSVLWN